LVAGEIRAAIDAVDRALRRQSVPDPPRVVFFRPPFGVVTGPTARAAAAAGLALVEWTVSVGDWRAGHPEDVTAAILARVRPADEVTSESRRSDFPIAAAACYLRRHAPRRSNLRAAKADDARRVGGSRRRHRGRAGRRSSRGGGDAERPARGGRGLAECHLAQL